jgi:hypothetical protein
MVNADDLAGELHDRIGAHFEWLLVRPNGRTFPIRKTEIDIRAESGKVLFGVVDDAGFGVSRVRSIVADEDGLSLELSTRFGAVNETIRLIPRTPARELSQNVELARLERANLIGSALIEAFPGAKLARIALNSENGRLAQIIIRDGVGKEVGVLADVTATMTHEAVMTSAMLWSQKLQYRKKPIYDMWIAAEKKQARDLRKLFGLFSEKAAAKIRIFEISGDAEKLKLTERKRPSRSALWREKPKRLVLPAVAGPSETAAAIVALAPDKTDIIFSKQGETIRFLGLPFARVRTVAGHEKAWFGIDRNRCPLRENNRNDLVGLVDELNTYRAADTPNKRHEFYRAAPEAWLESILRRNIRLLDANLILSPLYNQFRASADKIDLLAIRRDGRLVIVELKTSPDREMVFQAADYWRKIELQRRHGELTRARAFDDMEILDKPALVYAVAPALSFHSDLPLFAGALRREVEIWRFELREDWRSEIKILTRRDYPSSFTSL